MAWLSLVIFGFMGLGPGFGLSFGPALTFDFEEDALADRRREAVGGDAQVRARLVSGDLGERQIAAFEVRHWWTNTPSKYRNKRKRSLTSSSLT